MNSVIATKQQKIEMLIAGLPMVSVVAAAESSSDTGRPLGAGVAGGPPTGGEFVGLETLTHLVGDGICPAVRVRHVEVGDRERRDELRQAEQDPDTDVAEDLLR